MHRILCECCPKYRYTLSSAATIHLRVDGGFQLIVIFARKRSGYQKALHHKLRHMCGACVVIMFQISPTTGETDFFAGKTEMVGTLSVATCMHMLHL